MPGAHSNRKWANLFNKALSVCIKKSLNFQPTSVYGIGGAHILVLLTGEGEGKSGDKSADPSRIWDLSRGWRPHSPLWSCTQQMTHWAFLRHPSQSTASSLSDPTPTALGHVSIRYLHTQRHPHAPLPSPCHPSFLSLPSASSQCHIHTIPRPDKGLCHMLCKRQCQKPSFINAYLMGLKFFSKTVKIM